MFFSINMVGVSVGYFDQQYRQNLFSTWAHHLQQAGIQYRPDIARVEVLATF
jgi:dynein heavy chain 1